MIDTSSAVEKILYAYYKQEHYENHLALGEHENGNLVYSIRGTQVLC